MKSLKLIVAFTLLFLLTGCEENEENTITHGSLTINFSHYWDAEKITSADFNATTYTNESNNILTISQLRYLISNITLHKPDGSSIELLDHYLVNLEGLSSNTSITISGTAIDTYSSLSFTFGFNETDNVENYIDLNSASWNWPEMLGGGYHFMQFEGKYGATGTENPFAYHMGTARVSTGVFESNHFDVSLEGFSTNENTTIEIKMNLEQWFENPNTWDLNTYNTNLMSDYNAQKMMQQNGASVFSLGEIN
ncbi:MAG: hypothetical protein L3J14_01565 [Flavobacteriaceae bacterium]|nr:hypothetical protein [Flavobacteriaceae bacterium]